jgi:hypothetical protein
MQALFAVLTFLSFPVAGYYFMRKMYFHFIILKFRNESLSGTSFLKVISTFEFSKRKSRIIDELVSLHELDEVSAPVEAIDYVRRTNLSIKLCIVFVVLGFGSFLAIILVG